ncbi:MULTISPECIES: hypothetical protein [Ligilactobacillus]|uniref:hypothetical protein n=1 Tax=Ligilactobacillus TaxID=2767887 RepID=UPI0024BADF63|nr:MULTISPECIES: hypothetical protein [Ligilactobacillus]MDO3392786.1 hypothetical protein [Ligilactobacillus sp. 110_WCHN]
MANINLTSSNELIFTNKDQYADFKESLSQISQHRKKILHQVFNKQNDKLKEIRIDNGN